MVLWQVQKEKWIGFTWMKNFFDYAGNRTNEADLALYGRVTFEMMEGYWPRQLISPMLQGTISSIRLGITKCRKWFCQKHWMHRNLKNTKVISGNLAKEKLIN